MPGNKKVGGKLPYATKNPFDRRGPEAPRLPDHELRTQTPVTHEIEKDVALSKPSPQVRAAQKALGQGLDALTPKGTKTTSAGARTALAGMGALETAKQPFFQKVKRGVMVAMLGLAAFNATAGSAHAFTAGVDTPRAHMVRTSQDTARETMKLAHLRMGMPTLALPEAQEVVRDWQRQLGTDPSFEVTRALAADLVLAAMLPEQPPAGADVFSWAKGKLGAESASLIGGLLDGSTFRMSADARELLGLSIGRAQAVSADGLLVVTGTQEGGKLRLKGPPGAQVEVLNLSTIPTKRITTSETFVLGQVRADGGFEGALDMQEGDVIRLRLKLPDGRASEWVDFKATGVGADQRQAEVALFRIGLKPSTQGGIDVTNINPSRPVSEPGATMRFVNQRTSEVVDVTFDKNGNFPAGTKLPGAAGDKFSIRVTDGVHDKELAREISVLTVRDGGRPALDGELDLKDPTLHSDELDAEGKPRFSLERYRGPLFEHGAQYTDAVQGQIGDCYFPAAVSAIAFHMPGHFEKIMQLKSELDEVTGQQRVWYEVTFKERDYENGGFKDVVVKVDGDLYIRSWGGPLYGADDGVRSPEDMELWFAILEKAYAQWKGESYEAIGNGGWVNQVFEDLLGAEASSMGTYDADRVWSTIKSAVDDKRPIGAGTRGESDEALYANTGVYANHAYSILGYEEVDGTKLVKLRNPWGESEPTPGDGKNDGIFTLTLEQLQRLYSQVYFVEKP